MGKKKVLVGMSGGVDSSVAAALLLKRGFDVVGGFIKNWSDTKDLWTGECQWRADRRDAIRVAAKLGISLLTFDFEKAYRSRVLKEFFAQYKAGETPNPDVLCNQVIKFGLFFDEAVRRGFEYVATGHYARVRRDAAGAAHLLRGRDPEKDQSYFLYRVPQAALKRTIFPLGAMTKTEVRQTARKLWLPTAEREESQGICFIGEVPMSVFLRKKIKSRPGNIVDEHGGTIGRHEGLDLHTIGQRQGLRISRGGPWYVAAKDLKKNELIVVSGKDHPLLFSSAAEIHDIHWLKGRAPTLSDFSKIMLVQVRYRQEPVRVRISRIRPGKDAKNDGARLRISFKKPVRAVAPGQSAVIYSGQECMGGGIIS